MKRLLQATLLLLLTSSVVACGDDKAVLAEVNGKAVTQEQFDAYLRIKRIPADDEKLRAKALEEYLQREGLAQVIAQEGKLDKALIEEEVNEYRKEMLLSRYFDQFLQKQVSEENVQNAYGTDAAKYETKKVHAAHILIRTDQRMTEEQRKAKLTTAQEVYSKLQAGQDFGEVAKQYSEDKISGRRGGDLGWIKEGTIDERFSKRAFEMKAGSVTEPFESTFGFHILKVIEEPKTVRRPLGAVAGEIRYRLRNQAKDAERERLEKKVKVAKKASYNPKLTPKVESVAAPPARAGGRPDVPPGAEEPHLDLAGDPAAPSDPAVPSVPAAPGVPAVPSVPPVVAPSVPSAATKSPAAAGAARPKAAAPTVKPVAPVAPAPPAPAPAPVPAPAVPAPAQ